MNERSFDTGMSAVVQKLSHQSSNDTLMTRPSSRSMALILISGAVSGAITVQGNVVMSPGHLTQLPCATLPADAVTTPRFLSCSADIRALILRALQRHGF